MKFHVNTKTQRVNQCRARKGNCPYSSDVHFNTREEAEIFLKEKNNNKFSEHIFSGFTKNDTTEKDNNKIKKTEKEPPDLSNKTQLNKSVSTSALETSVLEKAFKNIGNKRENLEKEILNQGSTKAEVLSYLVSSDIKEKIKDGELPQEYEYITYPIDKDSFGDTGVLIKVNSPYTELQSQQFSEVKMNDGSYRIIAHENKKLTDMRKTLERIVDSYDTIDESNEDGFTLYDKEFFADIDISYNTSQMTHKSAIRSIMVAEKLKGRPLTDNEKFYIYEDCYLQEYEDSFANNLAETNATLKKYNSENVNGKQLKESIELLKESAYEVEEELRGNMILKIEAKRSELN